MVQAETRERQQSGEGLRVQVVQRVVAETKPFDVLQTLEGEKIGFLNRHSNNGGRICTSRYLATWKAMLGM